MGDSSTFAHGIDQGLRCLNPPVTSANDIVDREGKTCGSLCAVLLSAYFGGSHNARRYPVDRARPYSPLPAIYLSIHTVQFVHVGHSEWRQRISQPHTSVRARSPSGPGAKPGSLGNMTRPPGMRPRAVTCSASPVSLSVCSTWLGSPPSPATSPTFCRVANFESLPSHRRKNSRS